MNKPTKISRPRLRLRGKRLESAALRELADIESWKTEGPLTWGVLAKKLGVSRQAIATKPSVKEAYHHAQKELKRASGNSPEAIIKRTLESQLQRMKQELAEKDALLDRWIEKWVGVEVRCRQRGINPDEILGPSCAG